MTETKNNLERIVKKNLRESQISFGDYVRLRNNLLGFVKKKKNGNYCIKYYL